MFTIARYQNSRNHWRRPVWRVSVLTFLLGAIAGAQGDQSVDEVISEGQTKAIQAATSAKALVDLAKRFVLQREDAAARVCIAKACEKDPSLLTDDKRPSPSSWREFWFSYRAVLREKALGPNDAAGRVKIAIWLYDVRITGPARELLKKALIIDKSLPEAQKLAEAWYLFGGGPFQFDLTYALNSPLLPDKLSDEGTTIEPHRNQRFMLLPFTYEAGEETLRISKSSVKVTSDKGRFCRVLGIVLMETRDKSGASIAVSSQTQSMRLQAGSEPIWERIEITRTEDGTIELTCWNMTPPAGKQKTRSSGGRDQLFAHKKSSRSSSRDRRASSSRRDLSDRKQTRPASGYAAFMIQVPESMQSVEAIYNNEVTITLEAELMDALSQPLSEITPGDQEAFVQKLADKVSGEEPIVASAAVGKLAMMRNPSGSSTAGYGRTSKSITLAGEVSDLIDRTLLAGLVHAKEQVRQAAFDAIVDANVPLSQTCQAAFLNQKDMVLAKSLLEQIDRTLSIKPPPEDKKLSMPRGRPSMLRLAEGPTAAMGVADLPVSIASEHVFVALRVCLQHPSATIHTQAVDIALKDGSRQSAGCLFEVPRDTRAVLIKRFTDLEDGPIKAVLLRILIASATQADVSKIVEWLGACDQLAIKLTGDKDPVLKMLESRPPIAVQVKLIDLLGRADVSEPSAAKMLNMVLSDLVAVKPLDPALRSALLAMSLSQFQLPYHAPVARDSRFRQTAKRVMITREGLRFEPESDGRHSRQEEDASQTFESVLARLTTSPGADAKMVRAASAALLRAGRLAELDKQYLQLPDNQRAPLVRALSEDKALWTREALPIFLAGRLKDSDPWGAPAAMAALAEIYKATNVKQHWQLNAAVKLGIDLKEVAKLSAIGDDQLTRSAISLIRQLGHLSAAESDQLEAASDSAGRQQALDQLNGQRAEKFAGAYACMIYLDLKPGQTQTRRSAMADEPQKTDVTGPSAKPSKRMVYSLTNIPLVSSEVLIEQDDRRGLRISLAGRNIGETGGKTRRAGTLRINAAPLLASALRTAVLQKNPLAQYVDTFVLSESSMCDLSHKQMGTWTGEVSVSGRGSQESPLQIASALVVLERVKPLP